MDGSPSFSRKLVKQVIFLLAQLVVSEFMESNEESTFFSKVIQQFSINYSQTVVNLMVQIFKQANDDRFSKFVPAILGPTSNYLIQKTLQKDTKLLQLQVLLF